MSDNSGNYNYLVYLKKGDENKTYIKIGRGSKTRVDSHTYYLWDMYRNVETINSKRIEYMMKKYLMQMCGEPFKGKEWFSIENEKLENVFKLFDMVIEKNNTDNYFETNFMSFKEEEEKTKGISKIYKDSNLILNNENEKFYITCLINKWFDDFIYYDNRELIDINNLYDHFYDYINYKGFIKDSNKIKRTEIKKILLDKLSIHTVEKSYTVHFPFSIRNNIENVLIADELGNIYKSKELKKITEKYKESSNIITNWFNDEITVCDYEDGKAPTHLDLLYDWFKDWCSIEDIKKKDIPIKKIFREYLIEKQEKCKYGATWGRNQKNGTEKSPFFNFKREYNE